MILHCMSSFQVIFCCCTKSYFADKECRWELDLGTNKYMKLVPLLFENMKWPLEGDSSHYFNGIRHSPFYDTDEEVLESHLQTLIKTFTKKLVNIILLYVSNNII